MELQVALNTLIAVMMAIFPGFVFRKFYFRGEFTKQFSQSNEVDKLLWNVFFSGLTIGFTFLTIFLFKLLTNLNVLGSLTYEAIKQTLGPISVNKLPEKSILYSTYKDLIFIIVLIYSSAAFSGLILHWIVRALNLDIKVSILRFKNYWYYYFNGGKIIDKYKKSNKHAFTIVDLLCEVCGQTKIYKGILSQYTINKDNNDLENIFLTNAAVLKQIKNEDGETIRVVPREIPGATFCIPYRSVINMNLIYVYNDEPNKPIIANVIFSFAYVFVIASLWFDLSSYGIMGFWNKAGYAWWAFLGLANLRLIIIEKFNGKKYEWIGQLSAVVAAIVWLLHISGRLSVWVAILALVIAIIGISFSSPQKKNKMDIDSNEN